MEGFMFILCASSFGASAAYAAALRARRMRILREGGMECARSSGPGPSESLAALLRDEKKCRRASYVCAASLAIWSAIAMPLPAPIGAAIGAVAGLLLPRAWLKRRAAHRREELERALPGVLDCLALSVEAGEGFAQALSRVTAGLARGPLKEELGALDADMRIGLARRDALSALGRRSGSASLSFVAAFVAQAETLGVGIAPVLRASSRRLRAERLARAEKRGAAAAQKALLPLVFCIMPATFVVVFGPLIARIATGGIESLF